MKTNKKAISFVLAMVITVISSCITFAGDNITTYQKTTVCSDGIFKSNTIINGKVISSVEYPYETSANKSDFNKTYHPEKDDKVISYQPLMNVKELREQICTEIENIRAEVNERVKSALSNIPIYAYEPAPENETAETTQAATKETAEITTETTTNSIIDEGSDIDYSDFVKKVVELTNAERAKYGLQSLELSDALCNAAQGHAEDMNSKNYFSHTSQDGRTVSDRIDKYLSNYSCVGENIAYGYKSPESVVQGWMNSEGHRANILEPKFKYIGIGYDSDYWVQDFSG